jgi:hypothetical protein
MLLSAYDGGTGEGSDGRNVARKDSELKLKPSVMQRRKSTYLSSSMHFARTSLLGLVKDSGKVASG